MYTSLENRSSRGFTLIELLVVIAIIGLLASAVMVATTTAKTKAKDAKVKAEIHSIQLGLEQYAITNGGYPNPGVGSNPLTEYLWCIGATDCMIGDTLISNNINDKIPDLFPTYKNVDFVDVDNNHNKGYIYVSCIAAEGEFCPEVPTKIDGTDKAYLIYPRSTSENLLQVGTFKEEICSLPICQLPNTGTNVCGPQDNMDCTLYTNQNPGACNYDPDGTGEITTMCICGPNHNDSCTNYCGNIYLGSCNFDSNGTGQAGSQACTVTCGCTDPGACNFDSHAGRDNGSCEYISCNGLCNDPTSCNYGDPGLCNYDCWGFGCTDVDACNYDANAYTDDGSCEYSSCAALCSNGTACNYLGSAPCEYTSCHGSYCDDVQACNYGANAICDYESCHNFTCGPNNNEDCNNYCGIPGIGSCHFDPDGGAGAGSPPCDDTTSCIVYGCTNPLACNYDPLATQDNGCDMTSCLPVYGCMNPAACNYYSSATIDDDTCSFACYVLGCTDPNANNYNPSANTNDGSCTYYVYGCTNPGACNYNPSANYEDGSCDYNC